MVASYVKSTPAENEIHFLILVIVPCLYKEKGRDLVLPLCPSFSPSFLL